MRLSVHMMAIPTNVLLSSSHAVIILELSTWVIITITITSP